MSAEREINDRIFIAMQETSTASRDELKTHLIHSLVSNGEEIGDIEHFTLEQIIPLSMKRGILSVNETPVVEEEEESSDDDITSIENFLNEAKRATADRKKKTVARVAAVEFSHEPSVEKKEEIVKSKAINQKALEEARKKEESFVGRKKAEKNTTREIIIEKSTHPDVESDEKQLHEVTEELKNLAKATRESIEKAASIEKKVMEEERRKDKNKPTSNRQVSTEATRDLFSSLHQSEVPKWILDNSFQSLYQQIVSANK
jgi:hypothetical protein